MHKFRVHFLITNSFLQDFNIGLFYLKIWIFRPKKLHTFSIFQNYCWLKDIIDMTYCISLEPQETADFMIIYDIKPFSNCLQFRQFPARFLQRESFAKYRMIWLFLLNTWIKTCLSCNHACLTLLKLVQQQQQAICNG